MTSRRAVWARYAWIRRLLPFLRPKPGNLVLAFGAVVAAGLVGGGLLLVQRRVLDLAVAGRVDGLLVPIALLIGFCALVYLIQRIGAYRELKAANDAQFLVYQAVHRRMLDIDTDAQALPAGQLAARLNTDIDALSRAVALLPRLLGMVLSTAGTVVLMIVLSPPLALLTLLVVPALVLLSRRSRRLVQPATWEAQQREASVAQHAAEAIAGVRVVKALGQEGYEIDRMLSASMRLYRSRLRLNRLQALFQPLLGSVASVAQVIVVVVGGWLVLHHQMSLGTFLAFNSFSGQLVGTVQWFADTIVGLQEAGVSAGRVLDLLDLPPAVVESPDARPLPPLRGEVRIDDLTYGSALRGVDLTVAPGETVAVVGGIGSGKSTLVKLLARFHDPDSGSVKLDGMDLREATVASLRRQVAVVFDEPMLFTGTIRDNIAFGRPEADDEAVVRVARIAGAHDFVAELPHGYATEVGERGFTLSGGQRQRIALARALLIEPRVLILDDATGGVDAEREREIYRGLRSEQTTIFVGYRESTVALADRVVVLDGGRIVDQGRHEELLERSTVYRSLFAPSPAAPPPPPAPAAAVPPAPMGRPDWLKSTVDEPFSPVRLLWSYRAGLGAVLALFVLQAGMGIISPYVTRLAVDNGILAGSVRGLWQAAGAIVAMTAAGLILTPITMRLSGRVGQRVIVDLRQRVWTRLVRLPIAYFERQKAGRLLTRVINDVEAFSGFATSGLVNAVVAVLTAAGVLVAMLAVNPLLAGVVAVSVVPFGLLLRLLNRRIATAYLNAREQVAEANAALQEDLAGARELQAFGQQERQHATYRRIVRRYLDSRLTAERLISTSFPFLSFLTGMAGALVLGTGALLLAHRALSAGELIAFILWSAAFFPPIQALGQFFSDLKRVQVSTRRVQQLMAEETGPPAPARPVAPPRVRGELSLRGVHFTYPGTDTEVLHGVDLTVPAGSTVALVGVTGIGKSTIFKLLARFYDPTSGSVSLDGVDLRAWDPGAFRRHLSYLPQEPYLFSGTVRDNIAYGRPHATDAEVAAAARAVGADEAINQLPGGYSQAVGERGAGLPAGLRQLIALARAELLAPAVVLLDEATARLDLATEARVLEAIRAVAQGRTTVMIAHRLQTAMMADHIGVVDGGRIAEWGTHEQLMAGNARYAELFRASALVPA